MATKLPLAEQRREMENLKVAIEGQNKIGCIKVVRSIARNLGLAEAKYLVEGAVNDAGGWNSSGRIMEKMRSALREYIQDPFTKEQFMSLVSAAYDTHKDLFEDPLDSVIHALTNLKAKGGLEYAAAKDQEFIDSI